MNDLAGLRGIHPNSLRWNSNEGVLSLSVFDETLWQRVPRAIAPGSSWAVDMRTRQRGYGKATDKEFTMYLSPVGAELPVNIPMDDPELKPALSMTLWHPQLGEAVMTTCSAILRTAINAMWERYKSFREASEGLQPIVTFGEPREVEIARRAFLAPQLIISGWIERDKVPAFAMRPATVSLPIRADSQVGFQGFPAIEAKPKGKVRGRPQSSVGDLIDDEIPL